MGLRRVAAVVASRVRSWSSLRAWRAAVSSRRNKSAPAQALLTADKHDLLKLIEKQYQAIVP